ncbi:MAG: hypothetical protein GX352_05750 [Clostridiales bacterium]|nr:hypothetical protein [Clostridiales bacterium]
MANKKTHSWGWTIFWLIIFWPVGLFMLIKKLSTDKSAMMGDKTNKLAIVGWVLVAFGAIGFIGGISDGEPGSMIVALLFLAGGILVLRKATATKKLAEKYKRYIQIVVNQRETNIDTIASAVGLPYNTVIYDLEQMIDIGYLKDAYIHQTNHEIVMKGTSEQPVCEQNFAFVQGAPGGSVESKAVSCPGCGAYNTVIVGRVTECEYCGTPMS